MTTNQKKGFQKILKDNFKNAYIGYRALLKKGRTPDFIIVGVQKGGTTSFFNYLLQHPKVAATVKKEIHFFDLNYEKGLNWYKAHFDIRKPSPDLLEGEASPYYIYHPQVPQRVAATMPQVKAIVVLRNPVHRAISHYYHNLKKGLTTLSLGASLEQELEQLTAEKQRLQANPKFYSAFHHHFGYFDRGVYLEQIQRWHQHLPKENLLIVSSEEMFSQPQVVLAKACDFLELPHFQGFQTKERFNFNELPKQVSEGTVEQLKTLYAPHNQALYEYLQRDLGWD